MKSHANGNAIVTIGLGCYVWLLFDLFSWWRKKEKLSPEKKISKYIQAKYKIYIYSL